MRGALDQLPLDRVHDSFKAVLSSQLLIDVMEMIPQGLGADGESVFDFFTFLALCEHGQNVFLLF